MVEFQPSKLRVASSSLVVRSSFLGDREGLPPGRHDYIVTWELGVPEPSMQV